MAKKRRQTKSESLKDLLDKFTPIEEAKLRSKVVKALHDAGADWVKTVSLQWKMQIPNWSILGYTGAAPEGTPSLFVLQHPAVKKLQEEFHLLRP